jgi:hypothetical protein
MMKFIGILAISTLALAACDVTHPVAVVGPSDTVLRGTGTATFFEGGWFQASNGKTSCSGRYAPSPEVKQVTFPVRCTNGLTGIGTATFENPRAGGGEILMRDGTRWRFIVGQNALLV